MAPPPKAAKDRILDAANRLFYGEGIRAVSVDAIAEKAGVTKKTLCYHFKSKDEIVAAYLASRDQPNPNWKGCGFLRTTAELANMPGHPAMRVGAAHKKKFEAWLAERFAAEGHAQAESLARQVALLMEGAFSAMLVHRDPTYAETAGIAARTLLQSEHGR
jgi:AcrR family transcriptional regulator